MVCLLLHNNQTGLNFSTTMSPEPRDAVSNYYNKMKGGRVYFTEPGLSDEQAKELWLDDSTLPSGLNLKEYREACRALKGSLLRQEIYALDGSDKESLPYIVTERNYAVQCLQRCADTKNEHAVFLANPHEELTYNYERTLVPTINNKIVPPEDISGVQWKMDPRISHSINLEVDAFGNVLKSVAIVYGRRFEDLQLPSSSDWNEQTKKHIVYIENRFTNFIDDAVNRRNPVLCETKTYELTGYSSAGSAGRFIASDFIQGSTFLFDSDLEYHQASTIGRERRLLEHIRTL